MLIEVIENIFEHSADVDELLRSSDAIPDGVDEIEGIYLPSYTESKYSDFNTAREVCGEWARALGNEAPIKLIALQSIAVPDKPLNRKIWAVREFRNYASLSKQSPQIQQIERANEILNIASIDLFADDIDDALSYVGMNKSSSFLVARSNEDFDSNAVFKALKQWGAAPFFSSKEINRLDWGALINPLVSQGHLVAIGVGWNEDGGDFRFLVLGKELPRNAKQ